MAAEVWRDLKREKEIIKIKVIKLSVVVGYIEYLME